MIDLLTDPAQVDLPAWMDDTLARWRVADMTKDIPAQLRCRCESQLILRLISVTEPAEMVNAGAWTFDHALRVCALFPPRDAPWILLRMLDAASNHSDRRRLIALSDTLAEEAGGDTSYDALWSTAVEEWVEAGDIERALARMRRITWPCYRAEAFCALAPALDPEALRAALEDTWDTIGACKTLHAGYHTTEHLALIDAISSVPLRRRLLSRLEPTVATLDEDALEGIPDYEDLRLQMARAWARTSALSAEQEDAERALEQAHGWLERIPKDDRAEASLQVALALEPPRRAALGLEALDAFRDSLADDPDALSCWLPALAALSPGVRDACLEQARAFSDPIIRRCALATLAPHLSAKEAVALLGALVDEALIEPDEDVIGALLEAATRVPLDPERLEALLDVVMTRDDLDLFGEAAPHLDDLRIDAALDVLWGRIHGPSSSDRSIASTRFGALFGVASDALIEAWQVRYERARDEDAVTLGWVKRLFPPRSFNSAKMTLAHAWSETLSKHRAWHLQATCSTLAADTPHREALAQRLVTETLGRDDPARLDALMRLASSAWTRRLLTTMHDDVESQWWKVAEILLERRPPTARMSLNAILSLIQEVDSAETLVCWLAAQSSATRAFVLAREYQHNAVLEAWSKMEPEGSAALEETIFTFLISATAGARALDRPDAAPLAPRREAWLAPRRALLKAAEDLSARADAVSAVIPHATLADLDHIEALLLEQGPRHMLQASWNHVAQRHLELGAVDRATAAAERINFEPYRDDMRFRIALARRDRDAVLQSVDAIARYRDSQTTARLQTVASRMVLKGWSDDVVQIARSQPDHVRARMWWSVVSDLALEGRSTDHARAELDAAVTSLVDAAAGTADALLALSAAMPWVSPSLRGRVAGHLLHAEHRQRDPFDSWPGVSSLEVSLSAAGTDALDAWFTSSR